MQTTITTTANTKAHPVTLRTVSPGRTWDLIHAETGMWLGTITGKRRLRAVRAHIAPLEANGWIEWAAIVTDWKRANPRT